ncbi:leucyl aminopeptidase [Ktedonospora formicarum]|uniref:Probable cytosol aminopeptidase n=1 Tax=Ktedonospora formicarum TaxID=2778364 RepID=A0A8J3I337_9CHLR|nr:leucyl aminopeptidase [Ktedonospora formicarum]GHO45337.1 putative cytosol aminopeptidase [Ktedonospora formicarum]
MDIRVTTQAVNDVASDVLIVTATRPSGDQKGISLSSAATTVDQALGGVIVDCGTSGEFKGNAGEILTIHTLGKLAPRRVLVVGLGSANKVMPQSLRKLGASIVRHMRSTGAQSATLTHDDTLDITEAAQALTEGLLLGAYTFRKYQRSTNENTQLEAVQFLASERNKVAVEQGIQKGKALADATNFARDLVNEPPNVLTPTELANRASAMAREFGLECEVFDKAKIEELKMGGLLGVTQGSAQPPRFVILRYRGAPESTEPGLALVGKGITFDTGGISLKPAASMETMKSDMGGAAAVIGAMQAIAALKPKVNVTGFVPTCENMPSGTAYRPGDILRILNGKTIEIVNTDAEGRLILADALSYASQEGYSPIIDLATLTGGIVVALGNVMSGLFSNDDGLQQQIIEAGHAAGEKFWPMPLDEEYGDLVKSDVADVKQTGGRGASSVTAAKILEHFVSDAKWAHLDIAGTAFTESPKNMEKGGTGFGVRTLAELALSRAQ